MASLLALVLPGVSGAWECLLVGTPDSRTHPSPSLPPVVPSGSSASRVVPGCQACCIPGGERPTTSQDRQRGVSVGHQLSSHLVPFLLPELSFQPEGSLALWEGGRLCALTRERERGRPRPAPSAASDRLPLAVLLLLAAQHAPLAPFSCCGSPPGVGSSPARPEPPVSPPLGPGPRRPPRLLSDAGVILREAHSQSCI